MAVVRTSTTAGNAPASLASVCRLSVSAAAHVRRLSTACLAGAMEEASLLGENRQELLWALLVGSFDGDSVVSSACISGLMSLCRRLGKRLRSAMLALSDISSLRVSDEDRPRQLQLALSTIAKECLVVTPVIMHSAFESLAVADAAQSARACQIVEACASRFVALDATSLRLLNFRLNDLGDQLGAVAAASAQRQSELCLALAACGHAVMLLAHCFKTSKECPTEELGALAGTLCACLHRFASIGVSTWLVCGGVARCL
jgi:hypothetical protein